MKKKLIILNILLFLSIACYSEKSVKVSEFLNVETCFSFYNIHTQVSKKNIYGNMSFLEDATEIISANVGDTVILTITFTPTILSEKKSKIKKEYGDINEIDIPVKLICKGKNCKLKFLEAKNLENLEKLSSDGNADCRFTIKNTVDSKRVIKIEIMGLDKGAYEQLYISYGDENLRIVDSSCDVFETIQFK